MAKLIKSLGRYYNGFVIPNFLKAAKPSTQHVAQKLITDPWVKKTYIVNIMTELRDSYQPVLGRVNSIINKLDRYGGVSFKANETKYLLVRSKPNQDVGADIKRTGTITASHNLETTYGVNVSNWDSVTDVQYHKDATTVFEVPPIDKILIVEDVKSK